MRRSTHIPYTITNTSYENDVFTLTSDHYYPEDTAVFNLLTHSTSTYIHCYADTNIIYTFKKPIIPRALHMRQSSSGTATIYYYDDATATWVKLASKGGTTIDITLSTDVKASKIKIFNDHSWSQHNIHWCTLEYETESETIKNLVYTAIVENELVQQVIPGVDIE